jgi:hypothetical protein
VKHPQAEIQKLLDEHNAILEAKKREFELEINQKRESLDDELKSKVVEVEKREAEVNHLEQKVAKREQALEKKWEKLGEKEKVHESKLKDLKEREKSIRSEEKNLEGERKQILADKEDLLSLKAEVEKTRADNDEQLLKIREEQDRLKVSEEERSEYVRLQSELKQEIDNYRLQKELLLNEAEDLKLQKETFEREWDELDEKRTEIEKELKKVTERKEEVEKMTHSEEERLKNEKLATQECIQRELEDLKLAKESFAAQMEHEKLAIAEKDESERSQMLHDLELRKIQLETDMQNQLEDKEKDLREREKLFQEERERELDNINYLREVARREMEGIKLQRVKIEKERQEADENRKHLEKHQVEMRKDIDELADLSRKLKDQREQFIKERQRFISFVEKLGSCENCGQIISEFVLSDLESLAEIENAEVPPLPRLVNIHLEGGDGNVAASERPNSEVSPVVVSSRSPVSGGTVSWLRKCTSKIFNFSPSKKIESAVVQNLEEAAPLSCQNVDMEEPSKRIASTENDAELSLGAAAGSFDVQRIQSDNSIREVEASQDPSADDQSNINSKVQEVAEDSQPSDLNGGRHKPRKRGRRGPRLHRTRSVKAVVDDAKAILGEALEANDSDFPNGNAEDSYNNAESRGDSSIADEGLPKNVRKRNRAQTSQIMENEHDGDDSEGRSDSVVGAQRRKRRQKISPAVQIPGERRYNLRRPKA